MISQARKKSREPDESGGLRRRHAILKEDVMNKKTGLSLRTGRNVSSKGEDLQKLAARVLEQPPEVIDKIKQLFVQ
jgi:hypothetical protein